MCPTAGQAATKACHNGLIFLAHNKTSMYHMMSVALSLFTNAKHFATVSDSNSHYPVCLVPLWLYPLLTTGKSGCSQLGLGTTPGLSPLHLRAHLEEIFACVPNNSALCSPGSVCGHLQFSAPSLPHGYHTSRAVLTADVMHLL